MEGGRGQEGGCEPRRRGGGGARVSGRRCPASVRVASTGVEHRRRRRPRPRTVGADADGVALAAADAGLANQRGGAGVVGDVYE